MQHPNFLDKLRLKYNPHYLYPGQYGVTAASVSTGVIHRIPSARITFWKTMDYVTLKKGSIVQFVDYVRRLKIEGDLLPYDSLFILIQPVVEVSNLPSGHHLSVGDNLRVSVSDRQFIYPSPAPEMLGSTPG